jgi:hypothetical protein
MKKIIIFSLAYIMITTMNAMDSTNNSPQEQDYTILIIYLSINHQICIGHK